LFSFSEENCRAAKALQNRSPGIPVSKPDFERLPEDPERARQVTVQDLIAFFRHPARYFLEWRLGVTLTERDAEQDDNEPFELAGLDRYAMEQRLMESEIATGHMEDLYPALLASGCLPHGTIGRNSLHGVSQKIRTFVRHHGDVLRSEHLPSLYLNLEVAGVRISGQLEGLRSRGLVHYRYSKIKAGDRLKLWISHLLLQVASGSEGTLRDSLILGKDESGKDSSWIFTPVDNARGRLEELLSLYREGLRRPLSFFPETSWAYASRRHKTSDPSAIEEEAALDAARTVWEGSDFLPGEGSNAYNHIIVGDSDPLDKEFQETARTVYGPLLKAQRKNRGD